MPHILNLVGGVLLLIAIILGLWRRKDTEAGKSLPFILFGVAAILIVVAQFI